MSGVDINIWSQRSKSLDVNCLVFMLTLGDGGMDEDFLMSIRKLGNKDVDVNGLMLTLTSGD